MLYLFSVGVPSSGFVLSCTVFKVGSLSIAPRDCLALWGRLAPEPVVGFA